MDGWVHMGVSKALKWRQCRWTEWRLVEMHHCTIKNRPTTALEKETAPKDEGFRTALIASELLSHQDTRYMLRLWAGCLVLSSLVQNKSSTSEFLTKTWGLAKENAWKSQYIHLTGSETCDRCVTEELPVRKRWCLCNSPVCPKVQF